MPRSTYQALVNRGRKAGLSTSEIYRALESRPPQAQDTSPGGCDGNGFVVMFDPEGHATYHSQPISETQAS